MPKMIALKKQPYGGKNISIGDKFDVSIHHTRLLKALGRAADFVETTQSVPPSVPPAVQIVKHDSTQDTNMAAVGAMSTVNNSELVPTPYPHNTTVDHIAQRHVVEETKKVEEVEKIDEVEHEIETLSESSILDDISMDNVEDELDSIAEKTKEEFDMSTSLSSPQQTSEYGSMLRNRARSLGIRVDGRWSDERVQREIDEHNKKTYQRMDIRATE